MDNNNNLEFDKLIGLFEQTQAAMQRQAARSVDTALVIRNWLFGWYIVEFEKSGASRKELYGKELMPKLSKSLTGKLGKGFSRQSLDQFRQFYENYKKIWQTLPAKSQKHSQMFIDTLFPIDNETNKMLSKKDKCLPDLVNIWQTLSAKFSLSWSHYVVLLTIKSIDERKFYEIETMENSWGIRELKRQISSSLYERLALSRDKDQIKKLSEKRPLADFLPTVTIAAKNLATEITNHNVNQNDLQGEKAITGEHVQNNASLRTMLGERGIKPEELPAEEDLKKIERRAKSAEKKMIKNSEQPKELKNNESNNKCERNGNNGSL